MTNDELIEAINKCEVQYAVMCAKALYPYAKATLTPPDTQVALDALKSDMVKMWSPSDTASKAIEAVIDHLAPRIVREGFVVVPIDAPTQAMTNAWWKASNNKIPMHLPSYKAAMIAASKGD
jgi:hypothetical protein